MARNHTYVKANKGHGTPMPMGDKYKGGTIPPEARASKVGKTDNHPYSGPPVAKHTNTGA